MTVSEWCLIKLLPYILFEKYIYILLLEMASLGNQHCANCIGTLSFLRDSAKQFTNVQTEIPANIRLGLSSSNINFHTGLSQF